MAPFASSKPLIKTLKKYEVLHDYIEFTHSGNGLHNDNKLYKEYMNKIEEYLNKYMSIE